MTIEPANLDAIRALCLGFACSGLLASTFEVLAGRPASLRLLQGGDLKALASVPLLVFAAPYLMITTTIRRPRFERARFSAAFASALVAGGWSLLCGRLMLDAAAVIVGA